jgi:transposase-like protein
MKKSDIQCPDCAAAYRRVELVSRHGQAGVYRCRVCDRVLETFDGTTEIAYRLTVVPERKARVAPAAKRRASA